VKRPASNDQPRPVVRSGDRPDQGQAQRWRVEQLWGASSVGVSGGVPKCSKTWLGLGLALLERAGRRHRTVTGW